MYRKNLDLIFNLSKFMVKEKFDFFAKNIMMQKFEEEKIYGS